MRKQLFLPVALTSVAILLVVLAVLRNHASLESASLVLIAFFGFIVVLLQWIKKRRLSAQTEAVDKPTNEFLWLAGICTVNAIVALIQVSRERWDIGDTIGMSGVTLVAVLSIYESHRRKKGRSAR